MPDVMIGHFFVWSWWIAWFDPARSPVEAGSPAKGAEQLLHLIRHKKAPERSLVRGLFTGVMPAYFFKP
jgi:hypothetical protein